MPAREGRAWISAAVCAAFLAAVAAPSVSAAPGDATATEIEIEIGSTGSSPDNLFAANGLLFFGADTTGPGVELWKSDGGQVGSGTAMLDDDGPDGGIADGAEDSNPTNFASIGSTVFFAAQEQNFMGGSNRELWKLDPPYTTPVRVEDINTTTVSASSDPEWLTPVGTSLYFAADNGTAGVELWRSEPPYDASSTFLVSDINDTAPGMGSLPEAFAAVGNRVFFSADDGINGYELWTSDGSIVNLVRNINMGNAGADPSNPAELTNVNGTLLFTADDGVNGSEVWRSSAPYDAAETAIVEDINLMGSSAPDELTSVGSRLFFTATDAEISGDPIHGEELWSTTSPFGPAQTDIVADINPGPSASNPGFLADVGGTLFFGAADGTAVGFELWKSNGGALGSGTVMVADIAQPGNAGIGEITEVAGQAFFRANDQVTGTELWKSTGSGATLVRDINPTLPSSTPTRLTDVNGTLFFRATDGTSGVELWKATIEPAPPSPPATETPAPPATPKKKCKKKKKKGKSAAAAKKKKCKKKKGKK
jgi:trimeric autotransporter adhesin